MDFLAHYRSVHSSSAFPPWTDNSCPAWHHFLCQLLLHMTLHLILTPCHPTCVPIAIEYRTLQKPREAVTCPSSHSLKVARDVEFGPHWQSHREDQIFINYALTY